MEDVQRTRDRSQGVTIGEGNRRHELPGGLDTRIAVLATFPALHGFSIHAGESRSGDGQHEGNRDEGGERELHACNGCEIS